MLRFAGLMILREVHEKNHKWTWEHFAKRRDDRKRYVELFKKKETDKNKTLTGKVRTYQSSSISLLNPREIGLDRFRRTGKGIGV
jgi:hypothetical protein